MTYLLENEIILLNFVMSFEQRGVKEIPPALFAKGRVLSLKYSDPNSFIDLPIDNPLR